jgi:hypothetical protein
MHPLETDITLLDGRTIRVHGAFAVMWRNMDDESHREKFLKALAKWVDEYAR